MHSPRQGLAVACALLLGSGALWWRVSGREAVTTVEAGFAFDEVAYAALGLDPPITPDEMSRVETVARREIAHAFAGLRIRVTDRRDARYHVRVVQDVRDFRFDRDVNVAGRSRAMAGLGGRGEVSFTFLANSAMVYAPDGAGREEILEGIARGIGRAAVHEFAHQLLPSAPIHAVRDPDTYEYRSAARAQQYYGRLQWAAAWPLLAERLGSGESGGPQAAAISCEDGAGTCP